MPFQTTLIYNEILLRHAILAYWRRSVGFGFLLALAITALSLAMLLYQGNSSWVVGVLASVLLVGVLFIAAIYFVHLGNSMQKFKAMGSPQASFIADKSEFSFSSGAGQATLPWQSVIEVWQFPEFWLLLFSKAQFVTLPTANLPSEMRAFIVERVRANGGKIG
jgi:heme/copper-type cytochrome/quinol oxidase subunit 4